MTTTVAAKVTGSSGAGDKEKVEKRRALGRGLESLLPGPRVVRPAVASAAAPAGDPIKDNENAGKQQVPPLHSVPGRNDIPEEARTAEASISPQNKGSAEPGTVPFIHAVVEDESSGSHPVAASLENPATRVGQPAGRTNASAPTQSKPDQAAELRSAGQPGAAVPTYSDAEESITIIAEADRAQADRAQADRESRIPGNLVINLAIADIDKNPYQTRYVHSDDALVELTDSIKANGVLQPVMVRPAEEEGRYILILGERRLHASKLAGKETIPAMVRRVSEQQAAEMTIIENLQREDLSPLEQAQAFKVLSEEFKLTQTQIGERVGLSRESVSNYMRLLRLPRAVMQLLAEKRIKFAEAKELLKLEDNDQIEKAALYAVKKGMTIEQVERLVMGMTGWLDPIPGGPGTEKKRSGARWVDPNVRAAQMELERLLGVRVKIRDRKGKGKIVIDYATVEDYERVVGMLKGEKLG